MTTTVVPRAAIVPPPPARVLDILAAVAARQARSRVAATEPDATAGAVWDNEGGSQVESRPRRTRRSSSGTASGVVPGFALHTGGGAL
jgi:hypothetical protein